MNELDRYFEGHPERAKTLVSEEMSCALNSGRHCGVVLKALPESRY